MKSLSTQCAVTSAEERHALHDFERPPWEFSKVVYVTAAWWQHFMKEKP